MHACCSNNGISFGPNLNRRTGGSPSRPARLRTQIVLTQMYENEKNLDPTLWIQQIHDQIRSGQLIHPIFVDIVVPISSNIDQLLYTLNWIPFLFFFHFQCPNLDIWIPKVLFLYKVYNLRLLAWSALRLQSACTPEAHPMHTRCTPDAASGVHRRCTPDERPTQLLNWCGICSGVQIQCTF